MPTLVLRSLAVASSAFLLVACSGEVSSSGAPTSPEDAGASTPPGAPDGGAGASCGNGAREPGELCDGDAAPCETLSALYSPGASARCRSDCRGYDVATCAATSGRLEVVQPALREPALWGAAQCNREGAFPLVVQRGASTKRWVIRLEGGGACSPAGGAACYLRARSLTSPIYEGDTLVTDRTTQEGITLGNVPADFADASYAQLVYCSSDAWTGTQATDTPIPADATGAKTMPWRFAGRHNVRAALEVLAQRYGLDDGDPDTRIFFQGTSAGGHGVLHNVDQVVASFPRTAGRKNVWALANAASYFPGWRGGDETVPGDWSALDVSGAHSGAYWEDGLPSVLASWSANLGAPGCLAAHPTDPHVCFFAAELQPYLVEPAPKGLGVPVALATNLEDPSPQNDFGIVVPKGKVAFAPGGDVASKAWGDVHARSLAKARWVFAPRTPLGPHGLGFKLRGAGTPSLQLLMDAFVTKAEPDAFAFVDVALVAP